MTKLALAILCLMLFAAACQEKREEHDAPIDEARPGADSVEEEPAPLDQESATTVSVERELAPEMVIQQQQEAEVATADDPPPTGVVRLVVLSSAEPGVLQVRWTPVEPAPAGYWVSWAKADEDFPPSTDAEGNAYATGRYHTIVRLEPGVRYKVRVRAHYRDETDPNRSRLGEWSRPSTVRVVGPPSAPTGLRAEATYTGVLIEWNESQDDSIIRYQLVRELQHTGRVDRFWLDVGETSYRDVSADPDAPYTYYLHSINRDGKSPRSQSVFVRTLPEIIGRDYLFEPILLPMAPARANWTWAQGKSRFQEMFVDFTIHNDPGNWSNHHGYFLILMQGYLSTWPFYFGLQTSVHDDRGVKAAVFSRWGTRDLSLARFDPDEGWAQSSGHEGDFIGVRRLYEWGAGDYRARIAKVEADSDGAWFSVWLTERSSGVTTWIGALKFPLHRGTADLPPLRGATIELYGVAPARPIDTPVWHVSVNRPIGDGESPVGLVTQYPFDDSPNALFNSNVRYDPEQDRVHLVIGGITERQDPAARYALD